MAKRAINNCDIAHCTEHPLGFAVAMDSYPVGDFLFLFLLLFSCLFCFLVLFLLFSLLRSRDIPWVREIFASRVVGSLLGRDLVSATGRHLFGQRPGGTTL